MMHIINYLLEYNRYLNLVGIVIIFGMLILASRNRAHINYKLVLNGFLLQVLIGFLVLKTSGGLYAVDCISTAIGHIYQCAGSGSAFVFGNLANHEMGWGFIFAFKVLPIIIFFGAFMALLFHWHIIQAFVTAVSYVIRPLLGTSGAETLCAIANSFLGQTEAPLLIRHYLGSMTRSEMLVVMISGMATISGSILVVFAAMGVPARHLLAASVMAIPISIVVAKILYPETETPETKIGGNAQIQDSSKNSFDAIAAGTSDGLQLALNVAAMLIAFLSLIALCNCVLNYAAYSVNELLAWCDVAYRVGNWSINAFFSYLFAPFGYLLGFTGSEAFAAGQLIGTKVAVNELVAYSQLVTMGLSERAVNILTYALCGFSNFSCIGIQIGGIGALVPEKRSWLTQFGLLAVFGGTMANVLSALVAGLLL